MIKKIFTILLFLALNFALTVTPLPAHADNGTPNWTIPDLQIDIGELKNGFKAPTACGTDKNGNPLYCFNWIGDYIAGVYKYAIGIAGILATIVMMIGGFLWLTAGGNQSRIGEAKSWIGASLTGLIIALSSYLILYQVNPNLVKFDALKIAKIKPIEEKPIAALPSVRCGGIESRNAGPCTDASTSLNEFLTDLNNRILVSTSYTPDAKISMLITGISDSAGLERCRDNYSKPPCHHSKNSCHYGCGATDKLSHAVDIVCYKPSNCYSTLEKLISDTRNFRGYQCEDSSGAKTSCLNSNVNHLHINVR